MLIHVKSNSKLFGDLAREWNWDLMDLHLTLGTVPRKPVPTGAIVSDLPTSEEVKQLLSMGCHVVRMGIRSHPLDDKVPAVVLDLQAIGRMAAMHFAQRGFSSVGLLAYDPFDPEFHGHYISKAFRDCARSEDMEVHLYRLRRDSDEKEQKVDRYDRRFNELQRWSAALPKPSAILAVHDHLAAYLCFACRQAGIEVPEQIAILGCGNHENVCEMSQVPLSSIDLSENERVRQAMLRLRKLMNGEPAPKSPILVSPTGIVTRRSTDILAVDDPVVARAVRFIWDHFAQDLSVLDVAAAVGTSQRSLQRAFHRHLGRGINTELRRKRLERCCELLSGTTASVVDIAPICGFRSVDYLHRAFRKTFGTTPRKWRLSAWTGEMRVPE